MSAGLYWIPLEVGHLAIMARPRAGDWLADEVSAWSREGVDVVVSMLEPSESNELELDEEASICAGAKIEFISFPVRDRGVPGSVSATEELVDAIAAKVRSGASVAIHCRAGIGRSALLVACVLTKFGYEPSTAFELISKARGVEVQDTTEQMQWVSAFSRR